jgi:hypothetical protein
VFFLIQISFEEGEFPRLLYNLHIKVCGKKIKLLSRYPDNKDQNAGVFEQQYQSSPVTP